MGISWGRMAYGGRCGRSGIIHGIFKVEIKQAR